VAVVSNNSAHRWTADVPMLMPEVNPQHLEMITIQRKNRGWTTGCIVTKPNCSIQCYVPLLQAWRQFEPAAVIVSTYQAISGAGKTFATWPEMVDNVIPYIGDEEKKSETEPAKIWADIQAGQFVLADTPTISANCIRVPVSNGHLAAINVRFTKPVTRSQLLEAITQFDNPLADLHLPSAPQPLLQYCVEDNRPQTKLDRDWQNGMGISIGRLRADAILGWKCVALAHNTIRGAAGGAVLVAELLHAKGYL
ncbi:MAG TPA: aspartate-semialdehyde dehydrogenase, partial [Candidatus Kerfeldbacteria bacterium]|nr:aspartate-semialdehyde dehydrogenase [Candidatus Kerfeldbacteria bacterium]